MIAYSPLKFYLQKPVQRGRLDVAWTFGLFSPSTSPLLPPPILLAAQEKVATSFPLGLNVSGFLCVTGLISVSHPLNKLCRLFMPC